MTGPRRPPRLVVSLVLAAVFLLLGFVLPLLAGHDPRDWNAFPKNLKPSRAHWLGTTGLGQDTFWLLTYSLRNSLILGVLVGFFATVIGVVSWSTAPGDEEGCGGLTGVTPLLLYRSWILDTARKFNSPL